MKIIKMVEDSKSARLYYLKDFMGLAERLAFSDFNHYQLIPQGRPIHLFTTVNGKTIIGYKYENLEASRI